LELEGSEEISQDVGLDVSTSTEFKISKHRYEAASRFNQEFQSFSSLVGNWRIRGELSQFAKTSNVLRKKLSFLTSAQIGKSAVTPRLPFRKSCTQVGRCGHFFHAAYTLTSRCYTFIPVFLESLLRKGWNA